MSVGARSNSRSMLLLLALPFASGIALLVHVLTKISLSMAIAVSTTIAIALFIGAWCFLSSARRQEFTQRISVGALGGLLATIAYDGFRLIIVRVFHMSFWPFDIFGIFGRLLIGNDAFPATAFAFGFLYHYLNGIGFAIAYAIMIRRPNIPNGIAYGLFLETLMLSIYPSWLHLRALGEFTQVSILGHVAYGSALGAWTKRSLPFSNPRGDAMSIFTLARFWWITIPTLIARMWRAAALISFDGSYLLAFPPFAALAPPLAFALGMLLASGRVDESFPYFFSLASTSIFIAIGMMTAALGSWALAGYAIVDALRDSQYLPANIVTWLLLAWPLILAPMSARGLAVVVRSRLASALRIPINTAFRLLLAGVLIWGWTNAFAPMLRFVYTLRGMSSPPDAGVIPIQTTGITIVFVAVLATAVRVFLEYRAEKDSIFLAQRAEIMARLERAPQLHLPFFLIIAIRSAILTLLAAGLFSSPFQGLLFACVLFLIMSGLSSWREPYLQFIRPFLAIPIAVRFLGAIGLSTPIATHIFGDALISGTFLSLILASTLSLLFGMLIVPETIARRGKTS